MLLMIDVGNTNITVGVFKGDTFVGNFRLTTKMQRTSDEFGITLFSIFRTKDLNPADVEGVLISSVVPKVMHSLNNAIRKYFDIEPMILGSQALTGISIKTENPKELGADRIVDIAAVYHIYGGPALVIDFGTGTTYDYVNEKGEFEFGLIAPGIEISGQALWTGAAKVPEIEIKKPASIRCRNTITSMQGGLVFGYVGQTEYIIQKVKEEVGVPMKVIATGGLGRIIYNETDMIDIYDVDLPFKGMKIIYDLTMAAEGR
ncbi:MAG: type III pantothenate kinase [Turicibacter sp.]|nr:type III pantothenate kinase [Turicibacter sp.]